MKTSCFFPSGGESAQMLHTPSAQRTTIAMSTGKLVAIASRSHVRAIELRERLPRSKPKIWLVRDTTLNSHTSRAMSSRGELCDPRDLGVREAFDSEIPLIA